MKSAAYWEERAMSYKMMYEKLKAKCEIATDGETAAESEANSPVVASCEKPTAEEPGDTVRDADELLKKAYMFIISVSYQYRGDAIRMKNLADGILTYLGTDPIEEAMEEKE